MHETPVTQASDRCESYKDSFSGIDAYDAKGALVKGQLVPAFTTRCVGLKECDG